MPHRYDIAVVGDTAAGCAAAARLAGKGWDTVLIRAAHAPVESPLSDWVPGDFFRMPHLPSGLARRAGAVGFKRVVYHNAALDRRHDYRRRGVLGYLAPRGAVADALRKAARDAGTTRRSTRVAPTLRLGEDAVRVVGSTQTEARLLLVAHGRPGDIISDLSLPARSAPATPLVVTGLDIPLDGGSGNLDGALHVVEAREQSEMGLLFVIGKTLHVRIISSSAAAGNRAAELSNLVGDLQTAGILPDKLALGAARGAVWHPPASAALDVETHIAKRCILAGTAGGFAGAITGQTLWPSVRSALLSAEVAAEALSSEDPQKPLENFRNQWQTALGDYLRPPSTSLQMLLPLLFANQRIVGRFTDALLFGKNI